MDDKGMSANPEMTPAEQTPVDGLLSETSVGWVNGVQEMPSKTGILGVLTPPPRKSVAKERLEWAVVAVCVVFGISSIFLGWDLSDEEGLSRCVTAGTLLSAIGFLIPGLMLMIFREKERLRYSRLAYTKAVTGLALVDGSVAVTGEPVEYSEYKVNRRWWLVALITLAVVFAGVVLMSYGMSMSDPNVADDVFSTGNV